MADLRFHDNSNLSRGLNVRLDKFVYDPNNSAGGVAVEATRGPSGLSRARRVEAPTR